MIEDAKLIHSLKDVFLSDAFIWKEGSLVNTPPDKEAYSDRGYFESLEELIYNETQSFVLDSSTGSENDQINRIYLNFDLLTYNDQYYIEPITLNNFTYMNFIRFNLNSNIYYVLMGYLFWRKLDNNNKLIYLNENMRLNIYNLYETFFEANANILQNISMEGIFENTFIFEKDVAVNKKKKIHSQIVKHISE